MTYLHTIKVSKIIIINYPYIQCQLFTCPVSWNIYRFPKPNNTIKSFQILILHQTRYFHCFPCAIFQIYSRPYSFTIDKPFINLLYILFPIFQIRMKFPFTIFFGYWKFIQHIQFLLHIRHRCQCIFARPCFNIGTSPRGIYQSNRYILILMQIASEKITGSRKVCHTFGRANLPAITCRFNVIYW